MSEEKKKFLPPHVLLPNNIEELIADWAEREPEQKDQMDFFKIYGGIEALLKSIQEMDISDKHLPEVIKHLEKLQAKYMEKESIFANSIGFAVDALKTRIAA